MSQINVEIVNDEIIVFVNEVQPGDVTEDGIQTLTNKTIDAADNTIIGLQPLAANLTSWAALAPSSKVDATGGAASGLTLTDGYTEEVFAVTGTEPALSPTNGSIQTWTLTGNSTPTAGTWGSGQSVTLMVDDGSAYTINWASMSVAWKTGGGTAPTLLTTGYTVIELVKVGATLYGWLAGDA